MSAKDRGRTPAEATPAGEGRAATRFRAVLLDAGGTLIGPRESYGAVYARVMAGLGIERPTAVFESALRDTWEEMNRLVPAGADRYGWFPGGEQGYWLRFARLALEKAGVGRHEAPVEQVLEGLRESFLAPSSWLVYPEVPAVLDELRRLGARLAVVSNWDSRLPGLLDRLGLADRFDAIVVSHLEGIEKPHPDLFRRGLERLRARSSEALHVGDTPELDLAGARAAGLEAVLVDRAGRLDPSLCSLRDLRALPAIAARGRDECPLAGSGGTAAPLSP